MRVLVCGGRDFDDVDFAVYHLETIHRDTPINTVISGMAQGADLIGWAWAKERGINVEEYPADWEQYGRRAGPIRNKQMRDEGCPDLVMAFPGGTGTEHMIEISEQANINTWISRNNYFRKEDPMFGFLSNFNGPCGNWKTSEHYYQAQKAVRDSDFNRIADAPTPSKAKQIGGNIDMCEDWDEIKIDVMRDALRLKFTADNELGERLIDTNYDYLIEYAPWGDRFWGVDKNYVGENHLGRLLMERREELRGSITW